MMRVGPIRGERGAARTGSKSKSEVTVRLLNGNTVER